MSKSKGMMEGAHPTAPGGMSQKRLVKEMVERHGYDEASAKKMKWPEQIEAVIQGRLREDKARRAEPVEVEPQRVDQSLGDVSDEDDFDDLLAEFDLDDEADYGDEDSSGDVIVDDEVIIDGATPSTDEAEGDWSEDGVLDPEALFEEIFTARTEAVAAEPPPIFLGIPGVKDYIFDGHAGAGPSGAERWMNCTMSLSASRKFLETLTPNQQRVFAGAGTAARQGTTAHAAAEAEANLVLGRSTVEEVESTLMELTLNPDEEAEAYDDTMGEYITEYVDLIRQYAQDRGDDHVLVESRVEAVIPLTDLHEGEVYVIRGSADATVLPTKSERTLVVGDLKYGNGIDVDVDENPQIRLYAIGVLDTLCDDEGNLITPVDEIVYHIIQPRLGGIKTWSESVDDLLTWRDDVLAPALTKALYGANEGATYEPSELACQWCPARGSCPALAEARVEQAADLFDVIVEAEYDDGPGAFPETTSLSAERLGQLLTMVNGLVDLRADLKEEAQRRLHRGEEVPGYWLVNYSPKRGWAEGAADALEDVEEVWTEPTLMTPAQAEKALGKERFKSVEPLVVKPKKVPLISTGAKDKRSKWEGDPPEAASMFDDESVAETGSED